MLAKIWTSLEPGLCFAIGAVGFALPLRFLRRPDFTALASIVLGGIVAIATWQPGPLGFVVSALSSVAAGAALGLLTSVLTRWIDLILGGIIVWTAAQTPAYLLSEGGSVSVADPTATHGFVFSPTASLGNASILLGIGLALCLVVGMALQSRRGSLVAALVADARFVAFRHRYAARATAAVLMTSNAIIALAGGLASLRAREASVDNFKFFLPFALGAFFAGEALVRLAGTHARAASGLGERAPKEGRVPPEVYVEDGGAPSTLSGYFKDVFSLQRDETRRYPWLLFSYFLSTVIIYSISGWAASGEIADGVPIPAHFEHLVTAALIFGAVWLGRSENAKQ